MKFCIITNLVHKKFNGELFAYGPYVREMNIWFKFATEVIIVAPTDECEPTNIDLRLDGPKFTIQNVPSVNLKEISSLICLPIYLPYIMVQIFRALKRCDHIHLRCPNNMGLLGSIMQIFFPYKKKTAKYAGNWDPNSSQPWSYKLQQFILRNTLLTKNMKVLVYGEWSNKTKNILPFFTASYSKSQQYTFSKPFLNDGLKLVFVGTLSKWKNPMLVLQSFRELINAGQKAKLTFCGDGPELPKIRSYIEENALGNSVVLMGNINPDRVIEVLKMSHFLIFPSKSEGWPKAVAESMWWGCIPITTSVSCVPQIIGVDKRGVLVDPDVKSIVDALDKFLSGKLDFNHMSNSAMSWSRNYTLEFFEAEIEKLLV